MEFKGSKTEKNLATAFSGESQARNKYTYFASQARKEGYNQIADIFEETANQEIQHAKLWFKLLNDGKINDTLANLKEAAAGEQYEWSDMYAQFAKEAKEEGFAEIAFLFDSVAKIERMHMDRFNKLKDNLENKEVFKRKEKVIWQCTKCGFTYEGTDAPAVCPVCGHSIAYFEIKKSNY